MKLKEGDRVRIINENPRSNITGVITKIVSDDEYEVDFAVKFQTIREPMRGTKNFPGNKLKKMRS